MTKINFVKSQCYTTEVGGLHTSWDNWSDNSKWALLRFYFSTCICCWCVSSHLLCSHAAFGFCVPLLHQFSTNEAGDSVGLSVGTERQQAYSLPPGSAWQRGGKDAGERNKRGERDLCCTERLSILSLNQHWLQNAIVVVYSFWNEHSLAGILCSFI